MFVFRRTSKMSHEQAGTKGGSAADVTAQGIGSNALLGFFAYFYGFLILVFMPLVALLVPIILILQGTVSLILWPLYIVLWLISPTILYLGLKLKPVKSFIRDYSS